MALGFEQTATGYRATDDQIAFWESRDTCPCCGAIAVPKDKTADGKWRYTCSCDHGDETEWTREP